MKVNEMFTLYSSQFNHSFLSKYNVEFYPLTNVISRFPSWIITLYWEGGWLGKKKIQKAHSPNSPPGQCLMAILHLLDSAMVGHGIVSFAGFLTICRVRVSRPHLNPHVRLFRLQVPHSLQ